MSETRPPITAGPIARAFKFFKSTSVNCAGDGAAEGCGADCAVALGDADGGAEASAGGEAIGTASSS